MHRTGSIFLLVALVSAPSGCAEQAAPPSMDDVRAGSEPSQEGWYVQFVISEAASQTDESRPRVEIHADYMATFETPDSTYTEMQSGSEGRPILAYIFDEAGDTSAVLRSNRLILHEQERRFEALGNVVVETGDDKILESEHLLWMEDDRLVRTPGFVRIQTATERIQGYSLVADEDLETYTLARVTGQVTVEDDEEQSERARDGEERLREEGQGGSEEEVETGEERVGERGAVVPHDEGAVVPDDEGAVEPDDEGATEHDDEGAVERQNEGAVGSLDEGVAAGEDGEDRSGDSGHDD